MANAAIQGAKLSWGRLAPYVSPHAQVSRPDDCTTGGLHSRAMRKLPVVPFCRGVQLPIFKNRLDIFVNQKHDLRRPALCRLGMRSVMDRAR
jgi:hypothetical protein